MTPDPAERGYIHANAVALGEKGLLLRGPSGAGKSALTLALLARFESRGDFARLVADDRVRLEAVGGRLIAEPHPAIAGVIEIRGAGLLRLPYERRCTLQGVIEVAAPGTSPPRLPEESEKTVTLKGIALPRLQVRGCDDVSVARIGFFIQSIMTI
ncbi:HPr kinase/phosphorylase [Methylocystis echinoides]|uniref:HPr kinase n=1 Tax=Methylocystis echinoides TaxID=29468 RepID=A0A9W6GWV0_9HYPH|nr:HPr kinase/phosphatase C-terminal domain-containing protein [Methylocystis echinoides]GLI94602.1 HPr kinase [Methylocystis echinoides]